RGKPQVARLLAAERNPARGRAGPIPDRSPHCRAIDRQRLAIVERPDPGDMPSIQHLLRKLVLPETAALGNRIAEIHVDSLRTVAGDILVQRIRSPLISGIKQRLRPSIVASKLEAPTQPLVELHL